MLLLVMMVMMLMMMTMLMAMIMIMIIGSLLPPAIVIEAAYIPIAEKNI